MRNLRVEKQKRRKGENKKTRKGIEKKEKRKKEEKEKIKIRIGIIFRFRILSSQRIIKISSKI